MSTEAYNLFPQRVVLHDCDGFDQYQSQIVDYCYQTRTQSKTRETDRYTVDGNAWQYCVNSKFPFLEFLDTNIRHCLDAYGYSSQEIQIHFKLVLLNIGGHYSYQFTHLHTECDLSGILWVKIPEHSGDIIFHNDQIYEQYNIFNKMIHDQKVIHQIGPSFNFNPVEGRMILFPPNLRHSVELNESENDRISISFSIKTF